MQHIQRSEELIAVAEDLFELKHWADAVSRVYYAMFHTATAILLNQNIERTSHHALIAVFGELVAKPGLMDKKFHRYLLDAFSARSESDYLPIPETGDEEARMMIDHAKEFSAAARSYLQTDAPGEVV